MKMGKKPVCIDLFAGAGGLSAGLEQAGFSSVFANDIDPDACKSFQLNHPHSIVYGGNISSLTGLDVLNQINKNPGEVDLLVGGPPCQGFSTVGKKDISDPRNRLFEHYFRMVKDIDPSFVLFENVAGFKRMYDGSAYDAVHRHFNNLGYNVLSDIVNALEYGVPQSRDRTIFIGWKKEFDFKWPAKTHGNTGDELFTRMGLIQKPLTLKDALEDLPFVASGEESVKYVSGPRTEYQRQRRKGMNKLTDHIGPNHGINLLRRIEKVPEGGCILDLPNTMRPKSCFANTYARLWWDRPSTTITRNLGTPSSSRCIHPHSNRGLTTREGARLQSFDDDYQFYGSMSSKNLQIGNAVPPLLARAFGVAIMNSLKSPNKIKQKAERVFREVVSVS